MNEPVPAEPVTLEYAGGPAALPPPIRHPRLYLPMPKAELRRLGAEAILGAICATCLIATLGALSYCIFPEFSSRRLAMPVIPVAGMFVIGTIAMRLLRDDSKRGLCVGLWFGGFVALSLYGLWLLGIGYANWIVP